MSKEDIADIIDKYKDRQGGLIAMLEEVQGRCGYLAEDNLRMIADTTGHSLVDIYGVATFYRAFSLKPRGRHLVLVCLGTACHVRGAPRIVEEFENQLHVKAGETTADKEFTVETVNCLGACALGPTVVVDGHYFSHVSKKKVKEIIARTRKGLDRIDVATDRRIFPVAVSCQACRKSLMDPDYKIDGHPSIKFDVVFDDRKGWRRFSSLYGSPAVASEHDIPPNTISRFICPHCGREFESFSSCPLCGASMAALMIRDGCTLEVCTRNGCRGHMLNLEHNSLEKTE